MSSDEVFNKLYYMVKKGDVKAYNECVQSLTRIEYKEFIIRMLELEALIDSLNKMDDILIHQERGE